MLLDFNEQNSCDWCFVWVKGFCSKNKESNKEMKSFARKWKKNCKLPILYIFSTKCTWFVSHVNNYDNKIEINTVYPSLMNGIQVGYW